MEDDFNYQCRRRASPTGGENFGAGSGGEWYDGGHDHHYNGSYQVSSPAITLLADGSTPDGTMNEIMLLASAPYDSAGQAAIDVHADSHVRITTGSPFIPVHDTNPIGGVRVIADTNQIVALSHGPEEHSGSVLRMSSDGVLLHAAADDKITISAASSIMLSVAGGTNYISLTSDGIVIEGQMVWINCQQDEPVDPLRDDPCPDSDY
jgi:hypothetical protein